MVKIQYFCNRLNFNPTEAALAYIHEELSFLAKEEKSCFYLMLKAILGAVFRFVIITSNRTMIGRSLSVTDSVKSRQQEEIVDGPLLAITLQTLGI
jgi:hypothetical protein